MIISYQSFHHSKTNEVISFSALHPWRPLWPKTYIHKFVKLISSDDLFFDLFIKEKRVACAVLIDKIQNKGNDACLEILGLDQDYDVVQIYKSIISRAKRILPLTCVGIEITLHNSQKAVASFLQEEGFNAYYELYEMECNLDTYHIVEDHKMTLLTEKDYEGCFKAICESFKDNPEMAIPEYQDWVDSRAAENNIWLYIKDNQIKGFVNLIFHSNTAIGDISSVGVLPEQRGKGIGKKLLTFALGNLKQQGAQTCLLTVSAKNKQALSLYQALGFELKEHFTVYRFEKR